MFLKIKAGYSSAIRSSKRELTVCEQASSTTRKVRLQVKFVETPERENTPVWNALSSLYVTKELLRQAHI